MLISAAPHAGAAGALRAAGRAAARVAVPLAAAASGALTVAALVGGRGAWLPSPPPLLRDGEVAGVSGAGVVAGVVVEVVELVSVVVRLSPGRRSRRWRRRARTRPGFRLVPASLSAALSSIPSSRAGC